MNRMVRKSVSRFALLAVVACGMTLASNQVSRLDAGELKGAESGENSSTAARAFQDEFDAHLRSGEHHLARGMAASKDGAMRDQLFADIAVNQARHGAFRQSVESASYIGSDQSRSSTLSGMRSGAFGGEGGAFGGGVQADYDPLMELIENTVMPESWEAVGGPGTMSPFAAGVHVDGRGTLNRIERPLGNGALEDLKKSSSLRSANDNVRVDSRLRKVSLNRLEKEVQLRHALGLEPSPAMRNLAGLRKIEYIFVYPESNDIVLAGPAGDWTVDVDGRTVSTETGEPTLQLDDLVVCLRNAFDEGGVFGCSIDPRDENMKATQDFLRSTKLTGTRFRQELRNQLGIQDIVVNGIDPRTHAASVLVEADYRMKLIGIGLEESVADLESYLDMVELDKNGNPPPMDVVRWWFSLNYDSVTTTEDRLGYQINGQGVQVQSESEFLAEDGSRIHTGKSTEPTYRFADGFTKKFELLADKYPIYADLRNVFDLAMVSSVIREEGLAKKVDWNMTYFGNGNPQDVYQPELSVAPTTVETVMNHRIIESTQGRRRLRHTIVSVSGGVVVDPNQWTSTEAIEADEYGLTSSEQSVAKPDSLDHHQWWWD